MFFPSGLVQTTCFTTIVHGTRNVAQAARKHNFKRFMMISMYKAMALVNAMGMIKGVAEMVEQAVGVVGAMRLMAQGLEISSGAGGTWFLHFASR